MKKLLIILLTISILFSSCKPFRHDGTPKVSILKIEMHLSAFGVESDNSPSIEAYIDFKTDSSNCEKSYYNPAFKNSNYKLSSSEIKKVYGLLKKANLSKLRNEYTVEKSDQPTSTIIIYTEKQNIEIKDYGLEGDYPLQDLYKIVYKL